MLGNPRFTLAVQGGLGGATAVLVVDTREPPVERIPVAGEVVSRQTIVLEVSDPLADPQLALYGATTELAANDDWGLSASASALQAASQRVGAPALTAGSRDAALLASLSPGNYTVVTSGRGGGTGTALLEVFVVP